jgi:O-antigen ligase
MKKAKWLTDKYICLILLVFPLWTGFEGYTSITRSKYLFFLIATLLWLGGLLACLLLAGARIPRLRAGDWCALAFVVAAALSTALSPWKEGIFVGASRYDGLLTLTLYGCIFWGVSAFGEFRLRYVNLSAVACTLCCAVAVGQLAGCGWLFPQGLNYYDSGVLYTGAFLGTIGNTDVLTAYLSLCVPAFLFTAAHGHSRRELWLLLPAGLGLTIIWRSGVAAGAVAMAACVLICVPYYVNQHFQRRKLTRIFAALSLALVAVGLMTLYFWPGNSGTLWELSRVLHGEIQDSFGSSRVAIWRESLRLAAEHPLTGGGPDTFSARSALNFSRYVPESGLTLAVHVDNAHNEFLNYLVNLGLAGLLPYLALLTVCCRHWLRGACPAIGCALVGYLAQSFFGLGLCLVVPIAWIFLGLISARTKGTIFNGTVCKKDP